MAAADFAMPPYRVSRPSRTLDPRRIILIQMTMTKSGDESLADPANLAGRVATGDNGAIGEETRKAYPRISQAIGLIVASIVLVVAFGIPVRIWTRPRTEIHAITMETEIAKSLAIGLVIWWAYLRTGLSFGEVFPLKPFRVALVVPIVLMLLGSIILAAEVKFVMQMVWPEPASMKEATQGLVGGSVWDTLLAFVVLGPVTEEFLFRGVILQGFLRNYSRRKAILVSALLFALFHLNPWQFPVAFLVGVVLGWWLAVTGSLLPCLFGHALGNSLTLLISVVARNRTTQSSAASPPWPFWLVAGLLGASLMATGAWLERRWRVGSTT
jgi:membrane protease YdiL (CAAX protease family)